MVTIRKAMRDDARPLAGMLAHAFADDPVMRWLLPAGDHRISKLSRLFATEMLAVYLQHEEVYTTGDLVGGAIWVPPEKWRTPPSALPRALPRLMWTLRGGLPRAVKSVRAIEQVHPAEPHWYLAIVGTEPSRRREGIGTALLAPVLERCDRDFLPAYLESSCPDNFTFYRRLGFEVTDRVLLPGGGPTVLAMWRQPRP